METNDKGNITIEKGVKKPVKCYKFKCKPINRELMIHEDIDTKDCTSISDSVTGFRLFKLHKKINSVQLPEVEEGLTNFIRHYTIDGIDAEFKRIENSLNDEKKEQ